MSRNVLPILYNANDVLMLIMSFILHSNHKGLPMYSVLLILLQCLDLCFELVDEDEDLAPRVSGSDWLVVTRVTSDHCSGLAPPGRAEPAQRGVRESHKCRGFSKSQRIVFTLISFCFDSDSDAGYKHHTQ